MKTAYLYRNIPTSAGTFGIFIIPEANWCCMSLENPWEDNARNESCIPAGEYICQFMQSARFGCKMYQVQNVSGRFGILFHAFNFVIETDGCIGLGEKIGYINGKKCLIDSRDAMMKFEGFMLGERFKLVIKWMAE